MENVNSRNSKRGGMATHAGVALELGIIRPQVAKSKIGMSPQMEAILIWCQCRTREYEVSRIKHLAQSRMTISILAYNLLKYLTFIPLECKNHQLHHLLG